MKINKSPWLRQLHNNRITQKLSSDITADVVIVGAGIAGISTAFSLLEKTDKKVVVIEAHKLAHGASGHNAGQLTSYFEKPFPDMVQEFGLELAGNAARSIEEDAWGLLRTMYARAGCKTKIHEFMGYSGLPSLEHIMRALETNHLRAQAGVEPHPLWIAEESDVYNQIPQEYKEFITLVPLTQIQNALETELTDFIACLVEHKGCGNSARLCEDVVEWAEENYPDRFSLYEHTRINKVVMREDTCLVVSEKHTITTQQVILCTNGFENFTILSENSGAEINSDFHHKVSGQYATMAGFLEEIGKDPTAISYYEGEVKSFDENEEYFYMTRRHYEAADIGEMGLVCVGGPVTYLPDRTIYDRDNPVNDVHHDNIDDFIRRTYSAPVDLEYHFTWHGLMGYTENGVRMIGPDPRDSRLLYNLGCNGVGLLPSIFGADRVARYLAGEVLEPSIFDVRMSS